MKFDLLCDIVLEAKKDEKFARLVIGNDSPVFSVEDVLRDPNEPSKGLRTYLTHRDSKSIGEDHERLSRRAVRRINWIAKAAIKKLGSREISLNKLNEFIVNLLEKYQTKVMGYKKPDKLNTAREARIIGNLLLPPTKWTPQAKSVFIAAIDRAPGEDKQKIDNEQIVKDFNASADDLLTLFDPDLIATIKDIIRGTEYTYEEDEEVKDVYEALDIEEADIESEADPYLDPRDKEEIPHIASARTLLKDPRIKGIYNPRIVRKVLKSMIEIGSVEEDDNGSLTLPEEGQERWKTRMADAEAKKALDPEEIPTSQDVEEETPGETDASPEEVTDDEELITNPDTEDPTAATHLGYDETEENDIEIEGEYEENDENDEGEEEDEKEEKEESWY